MTPNQRKLPQFTHFVLPFLSSYERTERLQICLHIIASLSLWTTIKSCEKSWSRDVTHFQFSVSKISLERLKLRLQATRYESLHVKDHWFITWHLEIVWSIVMSMYVYLSVCLSVFAHISKTTWRNLTEFVMHVVGGRGSVLFWRRFDTSCTFGLMDDAMFSHNGLCGTSYVLLCGEAVTAF